MTISIQLPFNGAYPVTQEFGENPEIYSRFGKPGHNGVDFGCPTGTEIIAASDGEIINIGYDPSGYGNFIKIQHNGFATLYAHLSKINTVIGARVSAGEVIGLSDNTGYSTGPHLHFELRIAGFPGAYNQGEVNPLMFLGAVETKPQDPQQDLGNSHDLAQDNGQDIAGAGKKYEVIADNGLRVRLMPELTADIIGGLRRGMIVEVKNFRGEWAEISVFVHKNYLRPK